MKKVQTLKRAWNLCAPYHWYFAGILGFLLVQQLFNTVFPIIFGSMVTAVTKSDAKSFVVAISIWAFLMCLRGAIFYFRDRFEIKNLDYDLSRFLSRKSMEKFFSISMGQHHVGHSIIKRSVMSKGESAVHGIVNMAVYDFIPTILMIFLPLGFLLVKVPIVGICVLVTMVLFSIYTIKYNTKFVPKLRELDTMSNTASRIQGEFIENVDAVYVNVQEERVRKECDGQNEVQAQKGKPVWLSYVGWIHSGLLLIWFSQTVCVFLCGYMAYKGEIASGMFVTAYMWISSSLGTLQNIGRIQRNLAKSMAPLDKYFKFLDYEPDIVMPKNPISISYLKGRIEFMDVSFTYSPRTKGSALNDNEEADEPEEKDAPPEVPTLKNVSFVLEGGKRYAFVGKSGAGKSTLVGLILRAFDPQSGQILVDGVDLRMLDYRELRRNVGLVPQEVAMFDGTMRYNVTFGMNGSAEKVTDEELDRVARLSRVSEFFGKLEKGWDTIIGERGIKLSGGQRQRVGIARALVKNPHILILDEATSNLDTENEAQIRDSIREASVGKTTIIIAHRLATVRDADKIFVFDEGKIVGEGSHEELLQANEYYQRLVQNQVIMA